MNDITMILLHCADHDTVVVLLLFLRIFLLLNTTAHNNMCCCCCCCYTIFESLTAPSVRFFYVPFKLLLSIKKKNNSIVGMFQVSSGRCLGYLPATNVLLVCINKEKEIEIYCSYILLGQNTKI